MLPEPPPRQRRVPRGVIAGVIGVLGGAAIASGVYVAVSRGSASGPVVATRSPAPSASPSAPPSFSPEPPAVVSGSFNTITASTGTRLKFSVSWVRYPDDECTVHSFAVGEGFLGEPQGGFVSDCRSWEAGGYDIMMFKIDLKNRSREVVTLNLRNFVLIPRDGRSFSPVNVRAKAKLPTSFLPERQKLPPGANWSGYIAFDGRVRGLVPKSLDYIDGPQMLRQTFDGKHGVVPPR